MEAVDRYGVMRGGVMAVARLMRCHPFVRGGYDPVVKRDDICSEQVLPSGEKATAPASHPAAI